MRTIIALSAVLTATTGCSSRYEFHGDPAFSPEERATFEAAALEMAHIVGDDPITVVWDGEGDNRVLLDRNPGVPNGRGCYMVSRDGDRSIYITVGLDQPILRRMAMHEIGHFYGLIHHDDPGIMDIYASSEWTDADTAVCRHVDLCKP